MGPKRNGQDLPCPICGKTFYLQRCRIGRNHACSVECGREYRKRNFVKRFWAKVQKTDGCWLWTGGTTKDGSGGVSVRGKSVVAHRLSWSLIRGEIPHGAEVWHRCPDGANRLCVNPDHLFLTRKQGEQSHVAKLNDEMVRAIRKDRAEGMMLKDIAPRYGVDLSTISVICSRKRWRHVP